MALKFLLYTLASLHLLGIITAGHAIMRVRTAQGSVAWALSLITFPYLALPLYWVFGRGKFNGYVDARRAGNLEINHIALDLAGKVTNFQAEFQGGNAEFEVLESLAKMPFTRLNHTELLIDGRATFNGIFDGIRAARDYILVQFFIIRDDRLGRELQVELINKAKRGVRVFLLYDSVGCATLPRNYLKPLLDSGIAVQEFRTTRGRRNRFQLNFRNHRKIVVVDGLTAFVGGLNVGDEYMGRDARFGAWRDTHLKIEGPSVMGVQLSFTEDWYWATRKVPELNWQFKASVRSNRRVLVLPSGPADDLETCNLFFVHVIQSAHRRLWIASPYFVPDPEVVSALQLAGLRGVDVRIMLPSRPDQLLVSLSSYAYFGELKKYGIKFYRYHPGFLHQKVMLIDDTLGAVGTANLDNRSFRLNFEITILLADRAFCGELEALLERDFERCRLVEDDVLEQRSFWFQLAVRIAHLFAPIQ